MVGSALAAALALIVTLVAVLGLLVNRTPPLPASAVEEYADAVSRGDWQGAGAIASRAAQRPRDPAARVVGAMDAAMAGADTDARARLGDPADLPEPLRSRGYALLGGLDRTLGAGGDYESAAANYRRAGECTGTDCTAVLQLASDGLARSCIVQADAPPPACEAANLPAWTSNAEQSLVRSAVLLVDGHHREARRDLALALARITTADDCGCSALWALRRWAASDALEPGSEIHREVRSVGRSASRSPDDCQLFSENVDG